MSIVQVAGSIRPRTTDTPTDARQRVATLADIENIDLPFVGMLVYCVATDKYYKITALNVDEDAVESYEELATGGSAPSMTEVQHSGATPGTVTVKGGEYHTFSDAVDSLTIAFGTPDPNPFAESQLEFATSASFTGVTWPVGCKFANQQPMLVASSMYLVTVLHGIVAVTEVVAS